MSQPACSLEASADGNQLLTGFSPEVGSPAGSGGRGSLPLPPGRSVGSTVPRQPEGAPWTMDLAQSERGQLLKFITLPHFFIF